MGTIQLVTESLIRLAKSSLHPDAILVLADDVFEVKRTPSVILQGPRLSEDTLRRTPSRCFETNTVALAFEECAAPRLFHLDFDLIITTSRESELLEFQEKTARFMMLNPVLQIPNRGALNLTEIAPLGGLSRVNLSNLRQSTGRIRVEDCPIYDEKIQTGKIITTRTITIAGDVNKQITL